MRITRTYAIGAAAAFALFAAVTLPVGAASASTPASTQSTSSHSGRPYAGDPQKEAVIVANESKRLYTLKMITASARWQGVKTTSPYVVNLGSMPTLVLVAQAQPYTLSDLTTLIPARFVGQPDGSYLLSDNIVVEAGAVLSIVNPDGLTIRMNSSSKGFVSIIALGGSLVVQGSAKKDVTIESWDPSAAAIDTNTTDGRAYVRVIGGSATVSYTAFEHLGFWSGGTGGLSLTGTQTPASDTAEAALPLARQGKPVATEKTHGARGHTEAGRNSTGVHGTQVKTLQSNGSIEDVIAAVGATSGQYTYVTAKISNSRFDGNAYGLYVNGSQGVNISKSTVLNSLVDGIVFHRFVTNSIVTDTSSNGNAVDGFAMTRASTGVLLRGLTTNNNGRDGVSLNGAPLASGPNAAGTEVAVYGNNLLTNSTSDHNGRNGVTISGGTNIRVLGNILDSNFVGIVVTRAASKVTLTTNAVRNSTSHGIAVLGAVTSSTIESNVINGGQTGIYLRNASATVSRNSISNVHVHGVSFVGTNFGSKVNANTVSGIGPTAVDTARGTGVTVGANVSQLWTTTKPLQDILAGIFQPLTVLWIVLGLIVLISALSGIGKRYEGFRHPYADQVPLSELTLGVVRPGDLGLEDHDLLDLSGPGDEPRHRGILGDASPLPLAG